MKDEKCIRIFKDSDKSEAGDLARLQVVADSTEARCDPLSAKWVQLPCWRQPLCQSVRTSIVSDFHRLIEPFSLFRLGTPFT